MAARRHPAADPCLTGTGSRRPPRNKGRLFYCSRKWSNSVMIEQPAIAALNHLLKGQGWARERLRPFAGKRVQFKLAPLPDLSLRILDSGLLEAHAQSASRSE